MTMPDAVLLCLFMSSSYKCDIMPSIVDPAEVQYIYFQWAQNNFELKQVYITL